MNATRDTTTMIGACGGVTGEVTETPPDEDRRRRKPTRLSGRKRPLRITETSRYECGAIQDRTLVVIFGICIAFIATLFFQSLIA